MTKMKGGLKLPYCGAVVRSWDADRFLLSMLARPEKRAALWALFAFNLEIAKTREVVSETQLGLIRLQWWRDRIGEIYEGDPSSPEGFAGQGHQVLQPLAAAIAAHDLPRAHFDALIYAREFDLEDVLPGNVEGLINYADFTSTPLNTLALLILGERPEMEPVQLVSVNYALAGLLRAAAYFAKMRRCVLPEDLMKTHGQSVNKLYEFKRSDDLPRIIERVAGEIDADVKPQSRYLRGVQDLAVIYLKQLRKCGFDPFHPRMVMEPPFKVLRVLAHLA